MSINRNSAVRFADWILQQHPGLYQFLLAKAAAAPRRLGDLTSDPVIGDPSAYFDPNVTAAPLSTNTIESLQVNPVQALDPTALNPIDINPDIVAPMTGAIEAPAPEANGSTLTLASVFASTGAGLSQLVGLANQYFKTQQSANNAAVQTAVINAQAARVYGGANPAAISYVRNPVTGQLTPTLQTYAGTVPLSSRGLASIIPPGAGATFNSLLSGYGIWVLGGAAFLLLFALARR